ncbi:SWIM zinc finger family protein [Parafrankia sp. FMc2]|uniref:SWIM zinc finger family protein n=1 Tax=Parafrankia sp. FMc2 TaxID=3233196 RepID=UPI0034D5DB8B
MSSSTVSTVTRETVLALAPDAAAARAGERLSGVSNWSGLGTSGDAAWGACRGSGATPYRVVVLCGAEAASTCSCPSRKFPCKHALGLLFLVSGNPGALTAGGDPPEWVSGWLGRRAARVDAASARATQRAAAGGTAGGSGASGTARSASSVRALARREARVDAGVAELNRWLSDIARDGLGAAQTQPAAWWESLAARMVDAQAPGLAEVVREMARLAARGGADWPDRLADRLGCLHLLCQGWSRRAQLPPELVDVVRDRVGFSRTTADVLAGDRLAGPMDVLGERLFHAGKLQGRRQWLRSSPTGPLAPLVSFGVGRNPPPPGLPVLTRVQAEVAAYPGRRPARLALAGATGAPEPLTELAGPSPASGPESGTEGSASGPSTWREVLSAHATTLIADPWADPVAFVVRGITVLPAAAGDQRPARRVPGGCYATVPGRLCRWPATRRPGGAGGCSPWVVVIRSTWSSSGTASTSPRCQRPRRGLTSTLARTHRQTTPTSPHAAAVALAAVTTPTSAAAGQAPGRGRCGLRRAGRSWSTPLSSARRGPLYRLSPVSVISPSSRRALAAATASHRPLGTGCCGPWRSPPSHAGPGCSPPTPAGSPRRPQHRPTTRRSWHRMSPSSSRARWQARPRPGSDAWI